MSEKEVTGLQQKKLQVRQAVSSLEEDGRNEYSDYSYVTEAQVVAVLRAAMCEAGLTVTPTIAEAPMLANLKSQKGKSMQEAVVALDLTLHDTDSGECETTRCYGCGQDHGDKAIPKAIAMATKYALLKLFLLSTYDDADADEEVDKDPPQRQKPSKRKPPEEKPPTDPLEIVLAHEQATTLARKLGLSKGQVREVYKEAGGDLAAMCRAMKETLEEKEGAAE